MSDSLQPHGLQHTRLPCPSPFPRPCSNSCLLSLWRHPTISSLSTPSPPAFRVFSNKLAICIRWPNYWSFSFSINPSSEYSGLISFKIDWLDLLAVQGTLKSLLQHHSSKPSILQWSAFFIVQRTIYSFFIVQDLSEPLKSWCASWNLLVPSGACSWCFLVLFEYRTLWSSTCSFSSLNTLFVGDCFWELGKLQPFLLQTGQQRPRP